MWSEFLIYLYAILSSLTSRAHPSSVIRECLSVSDSHKRFSSLPSNGGFLFSYFYCMNAPDTPNAPGPTLAQLLQKFLAT